MELIAACVALTTLLTIPHLATVVAPAPPTPVVSTPPQPVLHTAAPIKKRHHPLNLITGMASWYGDVFDGRETASGETFAQEAMTACHRTLPFGTRVRVTDVSNGKSIVVRINDRGVLTPDRIIDLSHGAAQQLGMLEAGVTEVRLQVLDSGKTTRPL